MANMAKQMELFDEGGLMQEGGTVDPVSGNDVPVGSTQEEVRDDIPAQLSEGEFVMPADVVRYHGLDKMMALRDEAKMGLQRMEAMGQMGNADEATIPDGVPFDMDDLEMEDDGLEMAQGGLVNMANGGAMPGSNLFSGPLTTGFPVSGTPMGLAPVFPQVVVYGPDGTAYPSPQAAIAAGVNNYTMTPPTAPAPPAPPAPPTAPAGQAAAPVQAASAQFQPAGTKFTPTTIQPVLPTFQQTIGAGVPGVDYKLPSQQDDETKEADSPTTVGTDTTRVIDDGEGGDNRDFGGGTSLITGEKIAGYSPEEIKTGVASAKDRYAVTGNRGIDLLNFLPGGQFLKGLLGTDDKPSTGLFSNTPEAMPTGFTDSDGNIIPSASADYMKNLGGLPSIDTMTETTRTSGSPLPNMNVLPASAKTVRNLQNLKGMLGVSPTRYVGFEKGDLDPNSGGFFDKNGVAIDPETGGAARNEVGTMNYASFEDFKNAIAAGTEAGWRGGVISSTQYNNLSAKGKANYDKFADITKNRKGGGISVSQIAKENKAKAEADMGIGPDRGTPAAPASAPSDPASAPPSDMFDGGSDNDGGMGFDGDDAASGADDAMGDGSGSFGGNDDDDGGDYDDSFNRGGLAKQMKRSGLASKK